MTRSDTMLTNTISSSGSLLSARARARKEEAEKKSTPDAKADVVLKIIAEEKQAALHTDNIILDPKMTSLEKAAKIERLQDQLAFLKRLESRFNKALGIKPVKAELPK